MPRCKNWQFIHVYMHSVLQDALLLSSIDDWSEQICRNGTPKLNPYYNGYGQWDCTRMQHFSGICRIIPNIQDYNDAKIYVIKISTNVYFAVTLCWQNQYCYRILIGLCFLGIIHSLLFIIHSEIAHACEIFEITCTSYVSYF